MFTGIIDHCGEIKKLIQKSDALSIWIDCQFSNLQLGESIAVDGVCLTVTHQEAQSFCCDVSSETMAVSTVQHFQMGRKVNLERALLPTDRLGGHFVLGHVDATATLVVKRPEHDFIEYEFVGLPEAAQAYLIDKGSIAVNGVSLTINAVTTGGFKVMLVPHSLQRTNLSELRSGDTANIEYDYLAKIVAARGQNQL